MAINISVNNPPHNNLATTLNRGRVYTIIGKNMKYPKEELEKIKGLNKQIDDNLK